MRHGLTDDLAFKNKLYFFCLAFKNKLYFFCRLQQRSGCMYTELALLLESISYSTYTTTTW
jgi:hypothetical protein